MNLEATRETLDRPTTHECDSDCLVINGDHHDFTDIYTHAENCRQCEFDDNDREVAPFVFAYPDAARSTFGDEGVTYLAGLHAKTLAARINRARRAIQFPDDLPFE